jgi:phosphatidylglycerol:prolipoprotein diacylglycerol transferase
VGTPLGVPLHPTQVYEAVAELLILGLLLATERRGRLFAGRTFWGYMLLYGITRFAIEFYRGDPRGFLFGAISTSQFVSVILVPVAILMLYMLGRRPQPSPLEAARSMRAA